jgi:hypothetical protein
MPNGYLNAFRGPDEASIDRAAYSNRLMRNDVDRIPQRNAAEDMAIAADQQTMGQNRTDNARRMAADMFTAIADAPDPISTGAMLVQSQAFREIGGELKLPVDQFRPAQGDDPEQIRAAARSWAQAVGAGSGQQQRVQSTFVGRNGNQWLTMADGTTSDTGVPVSQFAQRPVETGAGIEAFNPASGQTGGLVSPQASTAALNQAAADRAAATTAATTTAQATAETTNAQRANERTLGVWQVAREGLVKALSGTDTGPVAGRLPPVTSGQQIAEGAVASVAPVLKQLFRSAGEGVFTDRDQQLLIDMTPNRTDHPEAAVAKIRMIDAIIEAKLSGQGGGQSGGGVPDFTNMSDDELRRLAGGGQ